MENVIDSLINIDCAKMVRGHQLEESKGKMENWIADCSDDDGESSSDVEELLADKIDYEYSSGSNEGKISSMCRAVTFDESFETENLMKKPQSKFNCKVYSFEGRGNNLWKSVFCSNHGVSLCQRVKIHTQNQTVFKIGSRKDNCVNTTLIKDCGWLSPAQKKWTC